MVVMQVIVQLLSLNNLSVVVAPFLVFTTSTDASLIAAGTDAHHLSVRRGAGILNISLRLLQ